MPVASRPLRRADDSFRGVLSTVWVCLWSRNLNNETTYDRAGLLRYSKKRNICICNENWLTDSCWLLCMVCWEKCLYIWRYVVAGSTLRTEIGLGAPPLPPGQNVWARRDTTIMMKTSGLQTEIDSAERHNGASKFPICIITEEETLTPTHHANWHSASLQKRSETQTKLIYKSVRFSQRCWWGLKSSAIWRRAGW
jgi:hypothetical protein